MGKRQLGQHEVCQLVTMPSKGEAVHYLICTTNQKKIWMDSTRDT